MPQAIHSAACLGRLAAAREWSRQLRHRRQSSPGASAASCAVSRSRAHDGGIFKSGKRKSVNELAQENARSAEMNSPRNARNTRKGFQPRMNTDEHGFGAR